MYIRLYVRVRAGERSRVHRCANRHTVRSRPTENSQHNLKTTQPVVAHTFSAHSVRAVCTCGVDAQFTRAVRALYAHRPGIVRALQYAYCTCRTSALYSRIMRDVGLQYWCVTILDNAT